MLTRASLYTESEFAARSTCVSFEHSRHTHARRCQVCYLFFSPPLYTESENALGLTISHMMNSMLLAITKIRRGVSFQFDGFHWLLIKTKSLI